MARSRRPAVLVALALLAAALLLALTAVSARHAEGGSPLTPLHATSAKASPAAGPTRPAPAAPSAKVTPAKSKPAAPASSKGAPSQRKGGSGKGGKGSRGGGGHPRRFWRRPARERLESSVQGDKWRRFVALRGRRYRNEREAARRFAIFRRNRERIVQWNDKFGAAAAAAAAAKAVAKGAASNATEAEEEAEPLFKSSGVFADLDDDEFRRTHLGLIVPGVNDAVVRNLTSPASAGAAGGKSLLQLDSIDLESERRIARECGVELSDFVARDGEEAFDPAHPLRRSAAQLAEEAALLESLATTRGEAIFGEAASPTDPTTTVDWRPTLTPVKTQGNECGSCWAHAAAQAVEAARHRAGLPRVAVSAQHILDCARNAPNQGCIGGFIPSALGTLMQLNPATESEYAYRTPRVQGECAAKKGSLPVITGVSYATTTCTKQCATHAIESALVAKLKAVGPVTVSIDSRPLQHYNKGVLPSAACSSDAQQMDHAMELVGYGVEGGKGHWIVRNTWGSGWGEKGFVRIEFGKGACGVSNFTPYVTDIKK